MEFFLLAIVGAFFLLNATVDVLAVAVGKEAPSVARWRLKNDRTNAHRAYRKQLQEAKERKRASKANRDAIKIEIRNARIAARANRPNMRSYFDQVLADSVERWAASSAHRHKRKLAWIEEEGAKRGQEWLERKRTKLARSGETHAKVAGRFGKAWDTTRDVTRHAAAKVAETSKKAASAVKTAATAAAEKVTTKVEEKRREGAEQHLDRLAAADATDPEPTGRHARPDPAPGVPAGGGVNNLIPFPTSKENTTMSDVNAQGIAAEISQAVDLVNKIVAKLTQRQEMLAAKGWTGAPMDNLQQQIASYNAGNDKGNAAASGISTGATAVADSYAANVGVGEKSTVMPV